MSYSPESSGPHPPSRVISQLIYPEAILAPNLTQYERDLLEKSVLGKNSHSEGLFRRFADTIKLSSNPNGINLLKIVVLPTGTPPPEIRLTRMEMGPGISIVFNDRFVGHDVELKHTQKHGVFSMTISDRLQIPNRPTRNAFTWVDPVARMLEEQIDVGSSVSISRTGEGGDRTVFLQGIINGDLVRAEVTERAELGFAGICNDLMWSPAV